MDTSTAYLSTYYKLVEILTTNSEVYTFGSEDAKPFHECGFGMPKFHTPFMKHFKEVDTYEREDGTLRYQGYFNLIDFNEDELQSLINIMTEGNEDITFNHTFYNPVLNRLCIVIGTGKLASNFPF